MSTYENAPACKMLLTNCACCGRPLLDAASVTAGMGPHCRATHGLPDGLTEEVRERANKLIYACALECVPASTLAAAVVELAMLGCDKLAERISARAGRVQLVFTAAGPVQVHGHYSNDFIAARGTGRWGGKDRGTEYTPANACDAVRAVRDGYGEHVLVRIVAVDGAISYANADSLDLSAMTAKVAAAVAGEPAAPVAPEQPTYRGSPSKTRAGTWGVCLTVAAEAGALVQIQARSGNAWMARLLRLDARRGWGDVWETERP